MSIIIAKNVSGSSQNFLGITLDDAAEITLSILYTPDEINADANLTALIVSGDIVINDGTSDLPPSEGTEITSPIESVNGKQGVVVLDTDDFDDTATVNKFYPEVDALKLAGIAESADVTNAVNVEAAGAVMESGTSTANMNFVIDDDAMTSATDTVVPTAESVVEYVGAEITNAITGSNNYKGGYNATTNTPDLESLSPGLIKSGHTWDITVAGFFNPSGGGSIELQIGDTLRARIDDPSTDSDWVAVQGNQTPASVKAQYEGNTNTNAFEDSEKIKVGHISVTQAVDLDSIESDTNTNNAKVSADGSVTTHSDVTDSGSGAIITTPERNKLGFVTVTQAVDLDAIESDTNTNNLKVSDINHVTAELPNVDNTSDANKPVSIAQQTALDLKYDNTNPSNFADDQTGAEIKSLYEVEANAFTDALFTKLAGIEAGAEVNEFFGTEYLETVDLTVTSSGTNVYSVLLIHTIPAAAPTGDYLIDFNADWNVDNANGVIDIGFDSGAPALLPLTDAFIMGVHNNTDWYNLKQTFKLPHTTGQDTTFLAKKRKSTGAGTVNVRNRKVKQWRIS